MCYNRTVKMAPTAQKANDIAIALGCHGSHAMGAKFMAGVNHTACETQDMTHPGEHAGGPKGNMTHGHNMTNGTNMTAMIAGRPDTTGMDPGKKFQAMKDAYEKKKKEAADKKAAATEKRAAATAKKAEATEKRAAAVAKKAVMETKKKKAQATRDTMLGKITDAKAKKKAEMAANAAIAGVPIKKVKADFTAANETEACDNAYAAMKLNASLGVCEVAAAASRRHLLAAYSVSVLLSAAEVDPAVITAALTALTDAGVTSTTVDQDALAVLATVPGIDNATLTTLTTVGSYLCVCI
jgi:hypothetical protein